MLFLNNTDNRGLRFFFSTCFYFFQKEQQRSLKGGVSREYPPHGPGECWQYRRRNREANEQKKKKSTE